MTKSNSRFVTFIAIGVLIIGLVQLGQAVSINLRSAIAVHYGANSTQMTVRTILAIGWACISIWQAFQLYRHRESSPSLLPLGYILGLYLICQLILALFSASVIDQQRWTMVLAGTFCVAVIGVIYQWQVGRSALKN